MILPEDDPINVTIEKLKVAVELYPCLKKYLDEALKKKKELEEEIIHAPTKS